MGSCPGPSMLEKFEQGILPDGEADMLQRHIASCAACQAAMNRLRNENQDARLLRAAFDPSRSTSIIPSEGTETIDEEASTGTFSIHVPGGSSTDVLLARGADDMPRPSRSKRRRQAMLDGAKWIIPDYERVQLCGEGSYGSVWAVRDRVGVHRALKIVELSRMRRTPTGCREQEALETYCRRIHRHPYLITVYHVGLTEKYLYYTMELADDQGRKGSVRDNLPASYTPLTMDTIIQARRLHPDVALELARRLLRGMSMLHSVGLVHRDIKPTNIVFVNRQPKLADIGMVTADDGLDRPMGTPRYMPPDHALDKTADIYAMGKVLHEMIAGPDSPSFPALPQARQSDDSQWNLVRVSEMIEHACADHAKHRYPSAAHMLEELEACAELPFASLFREVESVAPPAERSAQTASLQLGLALIQKVPWILAIILGFVVALTLIAKL